MGFLLLLGIQLALFVLGRFLVRRPKGPKPDFQIPKAEEGPMVPIVFGTAELAGNIVSMATVRRSTSSSVTRFNARVHTDLCWGVVQEIVDLSWDGKSARLWRDLWVRDHPGALFSVLDVLAAAIANAGAPVEVFINGNQHAGADESPALFGGDHQGGGVQGNLMVYWGTDAQPEDEWLPISQWYGPDRISRWPRKCYIRQGDENPFYLCANSPTPNPLRAIVRCTSWWEENLGDLSPLGQTPEEARINTWDANPAEILYNLLTGKVRGIGRSPARLDLDSFVAAAAVFKAEGLGLSLVIDKPQPVQGIIKQVLEHADATLATNPITGLLRLKPIRADYVLEELLRIDPAVNCKGLQYQPSSWSETVNQVRLTYNRFVNTTEKIGFVSAVSSTYDVASYQSTGRIRPLTIDMPYITNDLTAALVAERVRRAQGIPLAKFKGTLNRDGYKLMEGDPAVIDAAAYGLGDVVVRIARIDYGSSDNPEIHFEAIQDVFAVQAAVYGPPSEGGWTGSGGASEEAEDDFPDIIWGTETPP